MVHIFNRSNMKAIFNLVCSMLLACLCSCGNEVSALKTVKSLEGGGAVASRVGFQYPDGEFFWSTGDAIAVQSTSTEDNGLVKMNLITGSGQANGKFEGEMYGDPAGYAVYPYHSKHTIVGTEMTYHLPNEYDLGVIEDAEFGLLNGNSSNAPMYAEVENGKVHFKHLGGVYCVKLPASLLEENKVYTFEIDASTEKVQIAGDFTVSLGSGSPSLSCVENVTAEDKTKVSVKFEVKDASKDVVFYIPMPLGTYFNTYFVFGEYEGPLGSMGSINAIGNLRIIDLQEAILGGGA